MGVWEDAQRRSSQPSAEEHLRLIEEETVARQQGAIREFVGAMQRLGIPPAEHRFMKDSAWDGRTRKKSRHRLTGWNIDNPRGTVEPAGYALDAQYVITPREELFHMEVRYRDRPEELRRPLEFGRDGEVPLARRLVAGVERAVRESR